MEQDYYELCDCKFDTAFDKISTLNRYPWVGSNYSESNCRLLILGESHYATDGKNFSQEAFEEAQDKNFTRGVVNCVIRNKSMSQLTWKMYEGLLQTFQKLSPEDVKDFWSKVSFYNFIQRVMKSSDEKPTDEDKRIGWKCLGDVIKVLEPTSIIIVGVRNDGGSDALNDETVCLKDFQDDKDYKINNCRPRIGRIILHNKEIPLTMIKHSSQGYNPDQWREYLIKRVPEIMMHLKAL